MTVGVPSSTMDTHELVVPRSIPITFSTFVSRTKRSGQGPAFQSRYPAAPLAPLAGLVHSFEQRPDGSIARGKLRGCFELPSSVQEEPRFDEHGRETDLVVGVSWL